MRIFSRGAFSALMPCAMFCVAGCVEPNYRTEVQTNAQGAVEVHRVAKDSTGAPPVAKEPARAPAVVEKPTDTLDHRIEILEGRVRELNDQIAQLKREKAQNTTPAN